MSPREIPCTIMRGGTSRAVFLREADVPEPGPQRDAAVLRIFGSPDRRQIDGLGGADPLTSKLAIIGPGRGPDSDVTFTFGQVGIENPHVDYLSLCGNISAAVGLYAVQEGLAAAVAPVTRVRVCVTNLDRMVYVDVPVLDGRAVTEGTFAIAGVPGTGARIDLDLSGTAGSTAGALLPTGSPIDTLDVPGVGSIAASLVDIGNAHVFVRAADVGLVGTERPAEIDADPELLARLEAIRGAGAVRMKLASSVAAAVAETPARPLLGIVSPPAAYGDVAPEAIDLVSRLLFMQITHKTYAGTSTACTGVAAKIPGTVVAEATRAEGGAGDWVRIGHPAGVIDTEARVDLDSGPTVQRATLGRTARRILDGVVYL